MRFAVQLLSSAAVAVVVLAAYHTLFADDASPVVPDASAPVDRTLTDLADRVARLEARQPVQLRSAGVENVVARLEAIEDRLAVVESALATAPSLRPGEAGISDVARAPDGANVAAGPTAGSPLTKAQEQRVRKLVADLERQREQRRTAGFVGRALDDLGLDLTPAQRAKVEEAVASHMAAVREAFEAGRAEGLAPDEVRGKLESLNQKLRETLTASISAADADALVKNLTRPPGPPPGGNAPPPPPFNGNR